jgi:hypothetical protein
MEEEEQEEVVVEKEEEEALHALAWLLDMLPYQI